MICSSCFKIVTQREVSIFFYHFKILNSGINFHQFMILHIPLVFEKSVKSLVGLNLKISLILNRYLN